MFIRKIGCLIKLVGVILVVGVLVYLFKSGWTIGGQ